MRQNVRQCLAGRNANADPDFLKIAASYGVAVKGSMRRDELHQPHYLSADNRPLRIVIEPTASGKKWRATVDGEAICVSASPFIRSARVLLAKGHPADTAIEMWRPGATEWALRGQLGAVAATLVDGEKVPPRAKNVPPVNVPSAGYGEPPSERTRMTEPFLEAVRDPRWTGHHAPVNLKKTGGGE